MSQVYLNGEFMAPEAAKISPMDRGFLFGDGIYEVIPTHYGKGVGLALHLERMKEGLAQIGIDYDPNAELAAVCQTLMTKNAGDHLAIYLHVSRGVGTKRHHAFPENILPTVFAYTYEIAPAHKPEKNHVKALQAALSDDLRWQRCHIKSTSLLGNVLHFQQGHEKGYDETLLFNAHDELTEASSSNAWVIKDGVIATPPLDDQILPGITRYLLLDILRNHSTLTIEERSISKDDVLNADEVWVTSASKEVGPVVALDGKPVGTGAIGDIWLEAQTLYSKYSLQYA